MSRELLQQALATLEHAVSVCFNQRAHNYVMTDPHYFVNETLVALRAALAAVPPVPLTTRELQLIDGMIEVQMYYAKQWDGIANRKMADKQKGWDMERVELLRRVRAHGIAARPGASDETT